MAYSETPSNGVIFFFYSSIDFVHKNREASNKLMVAKQMRFSRMKNNKQDEEGTLAFELYFMIYLAGSESAPYQGFLVL